MSQERLIPGNNQVPRQGQALNFERVRIDNEIYFKDFMSDEFKSSRHPLPTSIRKARNNAILISFVEIACCAASFIFYERRKSRVILALLILCCLSTIFGLCQKLSLNMWGLVAHGMFSVGIIGGFYIYILVDIFLTTNKDTSGTIA